MRRLGLVAVLTVAVAACGSSVIGGSSDWVEPSRYTYVLDSRCGERALIGSFGVTVQDGLVTDVRALDGDAEAMLKWEGEGPVPTLSELIAEFESARSRNADRAEISFDPNDGHPTLIEIDMSANAIDDEACYTITKYSKTGEPLLTASDPNAATTTTTTVPVSDVDLSTVEAFVAFAKHVDPETFSLLPLADSVMLGLGPQIIKSVTASDLASPDAWALEWDMFRAHVGPISGLELLELLDGYQVQVGPHAHCAAPPQPPPVGLESHRRISVQPSDDSIDSCLNWFTVDLFVGTTGLVEAITLDVWEP